MQITKRETARTASMAGRVLGVAALATAAQGWASEAEEAARERRLDTITVQSSSTAGEGKASWQTVQKSTVVDMKDLLQQQPGVAVSAGNGASQHLFVRGLGENQLTFTVDGASNNTQIFHHQSRFMFDPALLKSVTIEKGAGAASAGIGVTGGAIRMTTVDAADLLAEGQNVGARLGLGVRSNKGWERSGAAYGRWGGVDAIAMGNWVTQKDYRDGSGTRVAHSALEQDGFLGKVGFALSPTQRIVLSHRRELQDGARPLRLNINGLANLPPFDSRLVQDTSTLQYTGRQLGVFDAVEASLFHIHMNDVKHALGPMPTPSRIPAHSDASGQTTGADIGLRSALGAGHSIKYGLNWRSEEVKTRSFTSGRGKEDKTDVGLYAEAVWQLAPLLLTTGLRYDHFALTSARSVKASGGTVNPSATLLYDVGNGLALSARIAQASRSPRLYEPYILGLAGGDSYFQIADGVKAERALNKEVGVEWSNANFSASASVFHQTVRDYLDSNGQDFQANVGRLVNTGYEAQAAWREGGWTARGGVAYSRPRIDGRYKPYGLSNKPTGRQWHASLSYRFSRPALEIGWRMQAVQALSETLYNASGAATGTGRMAGYSVHDVMLTWQPLGHDLFNVNLSIHNIANKQYRSQSNFCGISNQASCPPEAGRNVRVGVNYRF